MKKKIADFRSDTVTLPTKEMLDAIMESRLGDDVYREDETTNQLEKLAAKKMGKDAALLVSSGTQANLISLMSNTKRGNLVILEAQSHILWYEVGGISMIAGLLPWPVSSSFGAFTPFDIENVFRKNNIHYAEPAVICIENTHNRHGGTIIAPNQIHELSDFTHSNSLKLYMDGARIFNAAIGMKKDVKEFTKYVDNLMFSLSKGLSCPIGSVLVGEFDFNDVPTFIGDAAKSAELFLTEVLTRMEGRLNEEFNNALDEAMKIVDDYEGYTDDHGATICDCLPDLEYKIEKLKR